VDRFTSTPRARANITLNRQDRWRFYPDAAKALLKWAQRNGYNCTLEYTQVLDNHWGDFIVVYRKT